MFTVIIYYIDKTPPKEFKNILSYNHTDDWLTIKGSDSLIKINNAIISAFEIVSDKTK